MAKKILSFCQAVLLLVGSFALVSPALARRGNHDSLTYRTMGAEAEAGGGIMVLKAIRGARGAKGNITYGKRTTGATCIFMGTGTAFSRTVLRSGTADSERGLDER